MLMNIQQWQGRRQEAAVSLADTLNRDDIETTLELLEGYAQTLPDEVDQLEGEIGGSSWVCSCPFLLCQPSFIFVQSWVRDIIEDHVMRLMETDRETRVAAEELHGHAEEPSGLEAPPSPNGTRSGEAPEL